MKRIQSQQSNMSNLPTTLKTLATVIALCRNDARGMPQENRAATTASTATGARADRFHFGEPGYHSAGTIRHAELADLQCH